MTRQVGPGVRTKSVLCEEQSHDLAARPLTQWSLRGGLRWEAEATPIAAFIAWLYCFGLWLCVEDRSPFHDVGARDVCHLLGVIGVVAIVVPAGRPLRSVEGAVRVGAVWCVEEKLEGVRLTAPKMGNKGNKARGQRLVLVVTCWGQLPLWGGRGTTGILRCFGRLHLLWSLVVFARGCLFFSHLWRRNVRQTHCLPLHHLPPAVLSTPTRELCASGQKSY